MASFSIYKAEIEEIEQKLREISRDVSRIGRDVEEIKFVLETPEDLDTANEKIRKMALKIQEYAQAVSQSAAVLETVHEMYQATENEIDGGAVEDACRLSALGIAQDRTTKTFDDDKKNGTYGADQGNMAYNKKGLWFFGLRLFEDEDLYAFVRKQSRYRKYSQTQIAHLLDGINEEGCGYVAIVNNIFVEFEGREADFERVFGFPMYDKKGKANYDYLIVDFYANTDDRYYIDEPMGATALVNDVIQEYAGREDEFRRKYGCDPLINGTSYMNPEAKQAILDEYQNQSVVTLEASGVCAYAMENRFLHYMQQKGIGCETDTRIQEHPMTPAEINSYLDQGMNVNVAVDGFNLYGENGKIVAGDVGAHWMTVTGTTKSGQYIVSSWGKRYYINPDELGNADFYITDIRS